MKRISPFWIFFTLSLVFLVGLVTSYVLDLSPVWEIGFLVGLILTVLLGKLRMGLRSIGAEDAAGLRQGDDHDENPLSLSMGNLWRRSGEAVEEIRKRNDD